MPGYPTQFGQLTANFRRWFSTLPADTQFSLPCFVAGWATGIQVGKFWAVMVRNFQQLSQSLSLPGLKSKGRPWMTPSWRPYITGHHSETHGGLNVYSRYSAGAAWMEQLLGWIEPTGISLADVEQTDATLSEMVAKSRTTPSV